MYRHLGYSKYSRCCWGCKFSRPQDVPYGSNISHTPNIMFDTVRTSQIFQISVMFETFSKILDILGVCDVL